MLVLLLSFVVLSVVSFAALIFVVKGNESLKAQHRAYVSSVNSVYDDNSNVIVGLQGEIEDLLERRADDQVLLSQKDHHIAALVEEVARAASVAENIKKDLRIKEKEVQQARKHAGQLFNK